MESEDVKMPVRRHGAGVDDSASLLMKDYTDRLARARDSATLSDIRADLGTVVSMLYSISSSQARLEERMSILESWATAMSSGLPVDFAPRPTTGAADREESSTPPPRPLSGSPERPESPTHKAQGPGVSHPGLRRLDLEPHRGRVEGQGGHRAPWPGGHSARSTAPLAPGPGVPGLAPEVGTCVAVPCGVSGSLGTIPDVAYGGMSEKGYMEAFFQSKFHVHAYLLVALCDSIQSSAERSTGVMFRSSLGSIFTRLVPMISGAVNSRSPRLVAPERSSVSVRTVARQLSMRKKGVFPTVNANTFAGMAASTVTADVFRAFQQILGRLKGVVELFPHPSSGIVRDIGLRISTPERTFAIDASTAVSQHAGTDEGTALDVPFGDISEYVRCRLEGNDIQSSKELARAVRMMRVPDSASVVSGAGRLSLAPSMYGSPAAYGGGVEGPAPMSVDEWRRQVVLRPFSTGT